MKKILLSLIMSLLTVCVIATKPHINYVKVDTDASTIKWKGSKITESHEGIIRLRSGVLAFDHGKFVGGEFVINMATIKCTDIESEKKRKYLEDHLKDEDFFNVDKFNTSTLKIKNAKLVDDSHYKVESDLTIKGITHQITFATDIRMKGSEVGAAAKIKIDRTKWDITYKSGSIFKDLGDKIILDEIEFEIDLIAGRR